MNISLINGRCVQAGSFIEGAGGSPAVLITAPIGNIAAVSGAIVCQDVVVMRADDFNRLYGKLNSIRCLSRFKRIELPEEFRKDLQEMLEQIENAPAHQPTPH